LAGATLAWAFRAHARNGSRVACPFGRVRPNKLLLNPLPDKGSTPDRNNSPTLRSTPQRSGWRSL
jgi:hypothetical protein